MIYKGRVSTRMLFLNLFSFEESTLKEVASIIANHYREVVCTRDDKEQYEITHPVPTRSLALL